MIDLSILLQGMGAWCLIIFLGVILVIGFVLFEDWRINRRNRKRREANRRHG